MAKLTNAMREALEALNNAYMQTADRRLYTFVTPRFGNKGYSVPEKYSGISRATLNALVNRGYAIRRGYEFDINASWRITDAGRAALAQEGE